MFEKIFNFGKKEDKVLITIDREYGSRGDEIARSLSTILNAKLYDENLIDLMTLESRVDVSNVSKEDSFLKGTIYDLYRENDSYQEEEIMVTDARFLSDAKTIRDIAKDRNAIILGKCAGYILKDYSPLNIFIAADFEDRLKNVLENVDGDLEKAKSKIRKMDVRRINHYNRFTKGDFAHASDYDFTINTSKISEKEAVDIILYVKELLHK